MSAAREALLREANELESQGGTFQPELLRLRDELDAELLVQRFEDIEPEQAAALEARLGPLVNALVVAEPEQAARVLAGRPREMESVWLVASDTRIDTEVADAGAPDVVVPHGNRLADHALASKAHARPPARAWTALVQFEPEAEALSGRLDGAERRCRTSSKARAGSSDPSSTIPP